MERVTTARSAPRRFAAVVVSAAAFTASMLVLGGCPAGNPYAMSQAEMDVVNAAGDLGEEVMRRNSGADRLGGESDGGGGD